MAAKKQQNKVNSDKTARTTGSRKAAGTGAKNAADGRKKAGRPRKVQEPEPVQEETILADTAGEDRNVFSATVFRDILALACNSFRILRSISSILSCSSLGSSIF